MNPSPAIITLFQRAVLAWTLCWAVAMWLLGAPDLVTAVHVPPGPWAHATHALALLPMDIRSTAVSGALIALIGLSAWGLWRGLSTASAVMVALLFHNVMHATWTLGHGGMHLMAAMLIYLVLLTMPSASVRAVSFWCARVQLVLVYAVTTVYKLMGTQWTAGTAVGVVAGDANFGGAWLIQMPGAVALMTWSALGLQMAWPILIWWPRLRPLVLTGGGLFHLLTGWWIGVPEMGLAFVATYTIWTTNTQAQAMLRTLGKVRDRLTPRRWGTFPPPTGRTEAL